MSDNHTKLPDTRETINQVKQRKPYNKPNLIELGDLRTLTLGSSPTGDWDSGGGSLYEYAGDSPSPYFPDPGGFSIPQGLP